jgi:hypothetical protein
MCCLTSCTWAGLDTHPCFSGWVQVYSHLNAAMAATGISPSGRGAPQRASESGDSPAPALSGGPGSEGTPDQHQRRASTAGSSSGSKAAEGEHEAQRSAAASANPYHGQPPHPPLPRGVGVPPWVLGTHAPGPHSAALRASLQGVRTASDSGSTRTDMASAVAVAGSQAHGSSVASFEDG